MRALLIIVLFILGFMASALLFSCRGPITSTREVYDSTSVVFRDRFVTYRVPADSAKLVPVRIECDPVTNKPVPISATSRSTRAKVAASIDTKGYLHATASCDSLQGIINAQDQIITRLRRDLERKTIVEYRVPAVHRFSLWFMIVVIVLGVLYIVLRVKRILP